MGVEEKCGLCVLFSFFSGSLLFWLEDGVKMGCIMDNWVQVLEDTLLDCQRN